MASKKKKSPAKAPPFGKGEMHGKGKMGKGKKPC